MVFFLLFCAHCFPLVVLVLRQSLLQLCFVYALRNTPSDAKMAVACNGSKSRCFHPYPGFPYVRRGVQCMGIRGNNHGGAQHSCDGRSSRFETAGGGLGESLVWCGVGGGGGGGGGDIGGDGVLVLMMYYACKGGGRRVGVGFGAGDGGRGQGVVGVKELVVVIVVIATVAMVMAVVRYPSLLAVVLQYSGADISPPLLPPDGGGIWR